MKYTAKIVYDASESFSNKVMADPSLIRRRMNNEPKLAECLRQYAELLSGDFTDKAVKEIVMSAIVYGFMFREEVAEVAKKSEPQSNTDKTETEK